MIMFAGLFQSCSSVSDLYFNREYYYDAEGVFSNYRGIDDDSGNAVYDFVLSHGRVDDESYDLVSSGVVLIFRLYAPVGESTSLPSGTYKGSDDEGVYSFLLGEKEGDEIVGSVVKSSRDGSSSKTYLMDSGTLEIAVDDEGIYTVSASVEANSSIYSFEYSGKITTFAYAIGDAWF